MYVSEKIEAGHYRVPEEVFKESRRRYHELQAEKIAEFKADLEKQFGVEDHPKKDLLWRIAEEEGHSAGYMEVYIWYDRLVDLIK